MTRPTQIFAIVAALIAGLVASCVEQRKQAPTPAVVLKTDEADVYEALFRHLFRRWGYRSPDALGTYFLSIKDGDPPATFLQRFAGHRPPVKAASQARNRRSSMLYDPTTGADSRGFRADGITFLGRNTAEVSAGYFEANLGASGATYRLERKHKRWKVISESEVVLASIKFPRTAPTFLSARLSRAD